MASVKVAWKDVTVCSSNALLLDNAVGVVEQGSITALLGPSSGGKSVLLKLLAGRGDELSHVSMSGDVLVDGKRTSTGSVFDFQTHHGAYVPQTNDHLLGVLTVKEVIGYSLRLNDPTRLSKSAREARVNEIIQNMALESCQNTKIGTFYMAGISGGQKRRTAVACELVYHPDFLVLDEPTSGLDTTAAVKCIKYIRSICAQGAGKAGCVLSIHQPNEELLSLFGNIVLLVDGQTMFSGSLEKAKSYFSNLGVGEYKNATPTEHYLHKMDRLFIKSTDVEEGVPMIEYEKEFRKSPACIDLNASIDAFKTDAVLPAGTWSTSFLVQYMVLLHRAYMIAKRDYALYYLQYNIVFSYGLMIGAVFLGIEYQLDDKTSLGFSAIVWINALNIFVFVFKAFYFAQAYDTYKQERNNNAYSATASTLAELTSFSFFSFFYCCGWLVAYFMIGFPSEGVPFGFLLGYVSTFTAESVPHLVSQFTGGNIPLGLIICQGLILVLFMFSAGVFIRDENMPDALGWIKEISPFEHACDSFMANVYDYIDFECVTAGGDTGLPATINNVTETCTTFDGAFTYPCDAKYSFDGTNAVCEVRGPSVIEEFKGQDPDKWQSLLYLFLLGLGYRALSLFFQIFPPHVITTYIFSSCRAPVHVVKANKTSELSNQSRGKKLRRSSIFGGTGSLVFQNVKVRVTKSCGGCCGADKTIIDNISGKVQSGRLLALMGPSGAGKTTLLNALAGMAPYAQTSATLVTLKGLPFKKEHLGYVPQFDSFPETFTVYEVLEYAAKLRTVNSAEDLKALLEGLLGTVGLTAVKDTQTKSLAGGQLKLLSIAVGLVAQPKVLFLDEPTTGLDSTAAEAVVGAVKDICSSGKIVIMTLHQPSSMVFDHIDDLVMLSQGKLAYFGSVDDAPSCFNEMGVPLTLDDDGRFPTGSFKVRDPSMPKEAIADQMINAVSSEPPKGGSWDEAFMATQHALPFKDPAYYVESADRNADVDLPRPSPISKLITLTMKLVVLYTRDPGSYIYRTIACAAFGLFTGFLYFETDLTIENMDEISAVLFLWSWAPLYFAMASVPSFCISRMDLLHGYASDQHTIWQAAVAQFVASIPFTFVCGLAFLLPQFYLSHVNIEEEVFGHVLINVWMLALVMDGLMWTVLEASNSNVMISVTGGMMILGTFFLFAGFFVQPDQLPPGIAWLPYTVPTKYALEGTTYSMFHGQIVPNDNGQSFTGDSIIREYFGIDHIDDFSPFGWVNSAIVFAFVFGFRFQHFMLMYQNNNKLGSMAHFNVYGADDGSSGSAPGVKSSATKSLHMMTVTEL